MQVAHEVVAGDQVVIMSNGGFGGIHQKLLNQLAGRSHPYEFFSFVFLRWAGAASPMAIPILSRIVAGGNVDAAGQN